MASFPFLINAVDGAARTGVLQTARGDIRTPAFMPVGTAGTVKALTVDQVRSAGADIILGNTYHLMLRPGAERIKRLGGLHRFMRWDRPILTDSGGFQVMSLDKIAKVKEEGVTFQSHIDGSKHKLTPERSIEIQADLLGSDIVMQLDELVSLPTTEDRAADAMRRSARWGERSKAAFGTRDAQAILSSCDTRSPASASCSWSPSPASRAPTPTPPASRTRSPPRRSSPRSSLAQRRATVPRPTSNRQRSASDLSPHSLASGV